MRSYIMLDRKILEWEWYKNEHTKNVFIHCLLKAYWKDVKISGNIIPRGSFVSSVGKISEELDLTPMEVRTALKHLKLTNEVTSKGTNRNTVFTVTNYDLYQAKEQAEKQTDNKQITSKQQTDNEQTTNEQQTINKPLTTNEEYKEIEEDKKEKETKKGKKEDNIQMLNRLLPNYPLSETLSDKIREWIEYKIARKDSYVEQGMNSLIKKIYESAQKSGDFAVMDLIDMCMANNWKGIIWDKLEAKKVNNQRSDINASKQSQLEYLLNSIREDEMNEYNGS